MSDSILYAESVTFTWGHVTVCGIKNWHHIYCRVTSLSGIWFSSNTHALITLTEVLLKGTSSGQQPTTQGVGLKKQHVCMCARWPAASSMKLNWTCVIDGQRVLLYVMDSTCCVHPPSVMCYHPQQLCIFLFETCFVSEHFFPGSWINWPLLRLLIYNEMNNVKVHVKQDFIRFNSELEKKHTYNELN